MLCLTEAYLQQLQAAGHGIVCQHIKKEFPVDKNNSYTMYGRRPALPTRKMHVRAHAERAIVKSLYDDNAFELASHASTSTSSSDMDAIATSAAHEAEWMQTAGYVTIDDPMHKRLVSRLHLCIRRSSTKKPCYELYDMGSDNGVFIDGRRIASRCWTALKPGMRLHLARADTRHFGVIPRAEYEFLLQPRRNNSKPSSSSSSSKRKREAAQQEQQVSASASAAVEQQLFEDEHKCGICQELAQEAVRPSCGLHFFCAPCLAEWVSNKATCPICRRPHEGDVQPAHDVNQRIAEFVRTTFTPEQQQARVAVAAAAASVGAPTSLSDDAIDAAAFLVPEEIFVRARQVVQLRRNHAYNIEHGVWTLEPADACNTICRCCLVMIDAHVPRLVCRSAADAVVQKRPSFYHPACLRRGGEALIHPPSALLHS
jgi:hypothetical protein